MSDDLIDKAALDAAVSGEETVETEIHDETPVVSAAEEAAMAKGWVPKDQWKGPAEDWRPAKEFLDRGELIGKIMAQGRQIEELSNAVRYMSTAQQKQFMQGYQKAIQELKARRDAALEDGDLKQATQIADKLDEVKEQFKEVRTQAAAPQAPPPPTNTFVNWAERNTWYGNEETLSVFADSVGIKFKERHPQSTEAEMLEHVERTVKKEFAHRFQKQSAPNPDGEGRSTVRQSNPSNKYAGVEANMTDEQRQIMRTIIKTAGITKEQYLKDFVGR
jgi:hypothetical protein